MACSTPLVAVSGWMAVTGAVLVSTTRQQCEAYWVHNIRDILSDKTSPGTTWSTMSPYTAVLRGALTVSHYAPRTCVLLIMFMIFGEIITPFLGANEFATLVGVRYGMNCEWCDE